MCGESQGPPATAANGVSLGSLLATESESHRVTDTQCQTDEYIVTGKTLGRLPWKSKVPLQRNGMAAIPKIFSVYLIR